MSTIVVGDPVPLPDDSSRSPAFAALAAARGKEAVLVFFFRAFT
jgi:hypothetical protein